MNDTEPDPITAAVERLFGLSYLFPYQRLVVANILEAAEAAGFPIHWPDGVDEVARSPVLPDPDKSEECSDDEADAYTGDPDRAAMGRQIVILPTGAGKSLCFQLPAMLLPGPTLVIYPILSLMADQERRLRERGFAPVILRGGQSREERDAIWEKLRSGESRFIIANPEVLLTPQVMDRLGDIGIVHVVIDEAHCISEWGESFRPSYLEIGKILEATKGPGRAEPLVTAFTATASAPVLEKIERYIFGGGENVAGTGNGDTDAGGGNTGTLRAHRIIGNPDRGNISYAAQGCLLRDLAVRDLLMANQKPAIVFCSSRSGTEKLARYLRNEFRANGFCPEVRFYHAGLSREEKTAIEGWFFNSPAGILISTCAYGMGVDKANIRTVIHRDCPPSVEAYLQESGRAGRDGLPSQAYLLWGPDDESALKRAKTGADRQRLISLMDYARNTSACRREALLKLLNYEGMGETPESGCCDVCGHTASDKLREEDALLGFFKQNRRSYTMNEAVHILAQAENIGWAEHEVRRAIRELITINTLRTLKGFLWKGRITTARR